MKTLIFDMDGTLADTAIITMEAFGRAAPVTGLPVKPVEVVRAAIGIPNPEFYLHIYPEYPKDLVLRAGEIVESLELEILEGLKCDLLFPGVRDLLSELVKRKVPIHIASTGSTEHVSAVLGKTGIESLFESINCNRPEKSAMIKEIIDGRPASDFIMVGDMKKDVDGARENGIMAVGACFGYCKRGCGFDRYVDEPLELLEFIN